MDEIIIDNNNCKGCFSLDRKMLLNCSFNSKNMNIDGECPCTNCLVKVICFNSCKEYRSFKARIEDIENG